jgi:hypothetical protein
MEYWIITIVTYSLIALLLLDAAFCVVRIVRNIRKGRKPKK